MFKAKPDGQFGTAAAWRVIPGDGSASTPGPAAGLADETDEDLDEAVDEGAAV